MSNKTTEEGISETTSGSTNSRPSLAQVRAIVSYLEKRPELVNKKQRLNGNTKYKKHWLELTNNLNQINGAQKTLKGWIKFWSDKKRFTQAKKKHVEEGRMKSALTLLEHKILDLCDTKTMKKKKPVKQEPYNDDDSFDHNDDEIATADNIKELEPDRLASTESEHKQLTMIEKMVGVMDEQASALTQMAQASLTNSKALERIAEASHVQALAVERLVSTFETISASAHDIRNAMLGIDYTLKRCYPAQQRQNTTLFT